MKFLRIPALVAITALVFSGCNREGGSASQTAGNPLLAHVPADTAYVFANIEPTPSDVLDSFMLRMAPSLLTLQTLLDDFTLEVNSDDAEENTEARLLSAILAELDGNLNREGLEKWGLSMESHKVIYAMGLFPVVRIALTDPDALRAAIGRIETESGLTFSNEQSGGTDYWKISDHGGDGHGGDNGGIYIAILDDHVAFSAFPTVAEGEWLPAFLGQSLPAESIASNNALGQLNKDKGYENYGSGYLDLQRVADELLNKDSQTANLINSMGHYNPEEFGEVCLAEARALVAKAPRMVAGMTELTPNTIGISYQLEMESTLAGKLMELVADVPVADDNPDKLFTASLGLEMGRLRNFLLEQANAVAAVPFECEKLAHLNQQATMALEKLNQPMPPFINNLKGFRVSMDEVDFADFSPEKARGMISLEVEKPQMLVGMAQMFVPGMENLELEPGGDPIEVPQELLSFSAEGISVFAAMSNDSIGIATGENRMEDLAAFMEADDDNGNVFFSFEYDMSASLDFQQKMQEAYSSGDAGSDEGQDFNELMNNIQESYMQWLGRSRMEMSFTEDGLQIDSKMTFK